VVLTDKKMEFFLEQVECLKNRYDELHLKYRQGDVYLVGNLEFKCALEQETITDNYIVEIQFPFDYLLRPPAIKEIGGRIPRNVDHHVNPDHTLCLGPPLQILRQFRKDSTILGCIEKLAIPKLCWHSYNQIHPDNPLTAYSHGDIGIADYRKEVDLQEVYFEIFETKKLCVVLGLLEIIVTKVYHNNLSCPCKSGKILGDCHGKLLQSVVTMPYLKVTHLAQDYWYLKDKYRIQKRRRRQPK